MRTLVSITINAIIINYHSFIFIIGLQVQIIIKFKNRERETTAKNQKQKQRGAGGGGEQPKTKQISKKENILFTCLPVVLEGRWTF